MSRLKARLTLIAVVAAFSFTAAFAGAENAVGLTLYGNGVSAPVFSLRDVRGKEVGLSGFNGRVVLLNFWASWCGPCREEMPALERLWSSLGDRGLLILSVNTDSGSPLRVAGFVEKTGITFPVLLDSSGTVSELYRVTVLPTSFVIDRRGDIVGKIVGPRDWTGPAMTGFFEDLLR